MFEWFLESQGDSDISSQYTLNEFREYTIGRNRGYDISSQNTFVSRNHGVIIVKPDNSIYIKDLSSSNGVYINDKRITPSVDHILELNDLIGIGSPSTHSKSENLLFTLRRRRLTGLTSVEIREPDSSQDDLAPCFSKSNESALKSFEHLKAEVDENFRSDFRSKEQNNSNSTVTLLENAEKNNTNQQTRNYFKNTHKPIQKVLKNENIVPETDSCSFNATKNGDFQNINQPDNNQRIDLNNSRNIAIENSHLKNKIKVSNYNQEKCRDELDFDSTSCSSVNLRNEPLKNRTQINNEKKNVDPEPIKAALRDEDIFPDISASNLNNLENLKQTKNRSKSEQVKKVCNNKEINSDSSTCSSVIVNNEDVGNKAQIISCNSFLNDSKTTIVSNINVQKTTTPNDRILNNNEAYMSNSIRKSDIILNDILSVSTLEQSKVLDQNNKLNNPIEINVSSSKTLPQNENIADLVVNIKTELISNHYNKQSTSDDLIYISDSDDNMDEILKEQVIIKHEPTEHLYSFTQNEDGCIEILESEDDEDIFPRSQLFDDVVVKSEPKDINDDDDDDFFIESIFHTECGINMFRDVKTEDDASVKPIEEDEDFDDFEDDSNIWKQKLKQQQDIISCSQECGKIKRSSTSLPEVDEKPWFPVFDDQDLDLDRTKVIEIEDKLRQQDEEHGKIEISETVDAKNDLKSDKAKELELISKYKTNILELDKLAGEKSSDSEQGTTSKKSLPKISEENIIGKKHHSNVAELETSDEDDLIIRRKLTKHLDSRKETQLEDVKKKSTRGDIKDFPVKAKETPKKLYVKPPVIDAPFLMKGKRKASEDPKSPKESKSEKKRRKSIVEEKPVATVCSNSNTSAVADKSIREEFNKRKKKRRRSSELIDRNEKQHIQEERKKKLKELAEKKDLEAKKTDEKKNSSPPKHGTKPKVKNSESRGLFLVDNDSRRGSESKKRIEKSPEKDKKTADNNSRRESELKRGREKSLEKDQKAMRSYCIPKVSSKVKDFQKPSTSKTTSIATKPKENKSTHDSKSYKLKRGIESVETGHETKPNKKNHVSSNNTKNNESKIIHNKSPKSILKPNLKTKSDPPKKVSFAAEPQVKIFHSFNSSPEVAKVAEKVVETREEEILDIIFSWMPMWLEEQRVIAISPKLWMRNPLQMCMHFNSVRDYQDIVIPLMLLEFWRAIFKDWCDSRLNFKLVSLDDVRENGSTTCLINCHCLIYKNDLAYNPYRGDLIVMDIMLENKSSIKKFGYITDVSKRRNTEETINKKLGVNVDVAGIPQCAIYFTVMTKKFPCEVRGPRMMRIRWVSRISSALRVFKSVFYLEKSSLCNFILKPTIKDYKISMSSKIKVNPKLPLNSDQMLAVYEACIMCSREESGIYLLQGPPGTGKTTVIKTIIEQLLYTVKNVQNGGEKIKILVCAPSNGAIDELTLRLLELRSQFPSSERFKMIRLGPPNTVVHPLVKTILLSELIRKHLQQEQYSMLQNNMGLNQQFEYLVSRINMIEQKIVSLKKRNENYSLEEANLGRLKADLDKLKSVTNNWQRNRDLEELFIKGADVICTTLSSCIGHRMEELYNKGSIKLTCCIIDEATQSNEQHSLIPLMLGINKLVLVGDPMQLPATILSEEARKLGYGDSLFHRIVKNLEMHQESPIRILKAQYRMHPEICQFPNERFYKNQLVTATSVLNRSECILYPYRLFCLKIPVELQESEYVNKAEADLVLLIAKTILTKTKYNIGIITPYSKQKMYLMNGYKKLREQYSEQREDNNNPRLIINTVDAFQGQERDVIIISCVRFKSNVFLEDPQRLNVALTRARYSTIICGNAFLFEYDSIWKELEVNAKNRKRLFYANQIQALDSNYLENITLK